MERRLLGIVGKAWPGMLLAAVLGALAVGSNIWLLGLSAYLISAAALHPSVSELSVAIVGVRFFGIARAVLRYLERYVSHGVTFRLLEYIRVWFYQRLEPLAPAALASERSGELLAAIVGAVETLRDFYLRAVAPPLVAIIVLAGMGWFLLGFSLKMALIALLAFFIAGVLLPLALRRLRQQRGRSLALLQSRQKGEFVDTLNGLAEVLAYRQQVLQSKRLALLEQQLAEQGTASAFWNGLAEGAGLLVMNGAVYLLLCLGITLVAAGHMEGVYLAVVVLVLQSSFEAVLPLALSVHYLAESKGAAKQLFALADRQPAVREPSLPIVPGDDYSIEISGLTFRYQTDGDAVLKDVSFSLPAGSRTAVVGPSGAGKSTLVHLLLRFWEYEAGSIRLGRQELRQFAGEELRSCFSVVSQKTHIFNASIRDNILLAKPTATAEELAGAVSQAGLSEYIAGLPEGLDTMAGNNGQAMSGGQRQRIAIARAFLKNTPILILDEPTVGLDALTEQRLLIDLQGIMKGKTVLWITHRLSGLKQMDQILVLREGQIVEQGSQQQLLERQGLFSEMWQLQQDILE